RDHRKSMSLKEANLLNRSLGLDPLSSQSELEAVAEGGSQAQANTSRHAIYLLIEAFKPGLKLPPEIELLLQGDRPEKVHSQLQYCLDDIFHFSALLLPKIPQSQLLKELGLSLASAQLTL